MKDEPENTPSIKLQSLLKFVEDLFDANGLTGSINEDEVIYMDLRKIPEAEWVDHSSVSIPVAVQKYIDTQMEITIEETNAIEEAIEKFYAIPTDRWFIALDTACLPSIVKNDPNLKTAVIKPLRFFLLKMPDSGK